MGFPDYFHCQSANQPDRFNNVKRWFFNVGLLNFHLTTGRFGLLQFLTGFLDRVNDSHIFLFDCFSYLN
jgi:hypothetical protein